MIEDSDLYQESKAFVEKHWKIWVSNNPAKLPLINNPAWEFERNLQRRKMWLDYITPIYQNWCKAKNLKILKDKAPNGDLLVEHLESTD